MNKTQNVIIGLVVAALLVAAVFVYVLPGMPANKPAAPAGQSTASTTGGTSEVPSSSPAAVRTFTISGKPYSFTPAEIRVRKGDTVKVVFQNSGGFHDWVLDEFNARTPRTQAGESATVQFVADKIGTFEYYCSVGNHRQMGMKGVLVVE